MQIVFISVGEIKLDNFFEKYVIFFKLCNKRLKCVKFLKTVYWCSLVNKYKSRYRLVLLELWDSVYLLETSEYVFISAP